MRSSIIFILCFFSIIGFSGTNSSGRTKEKPLKCSVFRIKINSCYQTAFKIAGEDGLYTTLHGFFQTRELPGRAFSNYTVEMISNHAGKILYNELDKRRKVKVVQVSKIDIFRDLAYIDVSHNILNLGLSDGLKEGSFDSLTNKAPNAVVLSWGYSAKFTAVPLNILENAQTIRDQFGPHLLMKETGVPGPDCQIAIVCPGGLFKGNSGAPILNAQDSSLIAVAEAVNDPNWQWSVISDLTAIRKKKRLQGNGR
jgi:hypothetical protein